MENLPQMFADAEQKLTQKLSLMSALVVAGSDVDVLRAQRVAHQEARRALTQYLDVARRLGLLVE